MDIFFTVLLDEGIRSAEEVEAALVNDASAGAPWYNQQSCEEL